jgi:glycine dehydrogenase
LQKEVNFRYSDGLIGISFDETKHLDDVQPFWISSQRHLEIVRIRPGKRVRKVEVDLPEALTRTQIILIIRFSTNSILSMKCFVT